MKKLSIILLSAMFLSACAGHEESPSPIMPVTQPMTYQEPAPTYSNPGSLYSHVDTVDLYADGRARNVGDIVLINVVENNTASNEAATSTSRDSSRDIGVDALFGQNSIPLFGTTANPMLSTTHTSGFDGSGATERSNTITATVAARVVRVYPDGLMQVEGARETRVNNETQYIVVTGLVRPRDVQPDNSILSTQMADAQIEYWGSGVIADEQRAGWLSRLLNIVWPL